MKIIIGEILILIGTCVYACCVIAGRADEEMGIKIITKNKVYVSIPYFLYFIFVYSIY